MPVGQTVLSSQGEPGATVTKTLTDAWQLLTTVYGSNTAITSAIAIVVSVDTNDMRVAWAEQVPTGTVGHEVIAEDMVRFVGRSWITKCYVKNSTASSNAVINITPEY